MTWQVWMSFLSLVFVFLLTPGSSHLLMLGNSAVYGFRRSIATAMGDLSANVLQMLAAGLGLAVIIQSSPKVFLAVQWFGVAYLIYLGVSMIRGTRKASAQETQSHCLLRRAFSSFHQSRRPAATSTGCADRDLYRHGWRIFDDVWLFRRKNRRAHERTTTSYC